MHATNNKSFSSIKEQTEFSISQLQNIAWFLYNLENDSCTDKVNFAFLWQQQIDYHLLEKALQQLLQRHSLLNSKYIENSGKVTRRISDINTIKSKDILEHVDASAWEEDELQHQLSKFSQRPFDLAAGLTLRIGVFSRTLTNHVILLTGHQIVSDHWSLFAIADELLSLYQSQISDTTIHLPKISTTYQDYVQEEINLLESAVGEELREWWQNKLAGELPILNLPRSRSRPPVRSYKGASEQFNIPAELVFKIKRFSQSQKFECSQEFESQKVDISTVFLAAFGLLIYRYTNVEDILIGLLSDSRSQGNYERLVGNLANITVIRNSIYEGLSFEEYLQQVKAEVNEACSRCNYPFPQLVKELQLNSQLSHPPICQVGFEYHNLSKLENISQLCDRNNHKFEYFELSQQRTDFDLSLSILESPEGLISSIHYNSDLFEPDFISSTVERFQVLLTAIVETPQKSIAQLPLLTQQEQNKLLIDWNNTEKNYDLSYCLHQLFEAQVERTPNANAVTFGEETLTYRELNNRANQLAHYLQTLGVKPEVLVGICIERSLEMVVGLLGILKAGGAYVPLDPEYPSQRLADMLEDSQVSVLLTQEKLLTQLPKHQTQTKDACRDVKFLRLHRY